MGELVSMLEYMEKKVAELFTEYEKEHNYRLELEKQLLDLRSEESKLKSELSEMEEFI